MKTFSKRHTQVMKGIAMLMLLVCHALPVIQEWQTGLWGDIVKTGISLSDLCRGIFAVLSGYGMYLSFDAKKKKTGGVSLWRFSFSHIMKLYAVFWLVSILAILAVSVIKGDFGEIYKGHPFYYAALDVMALSYIAKSPKFVNSWWYMTATLIYYCLFPVFWRLIHKLKRLNIGFFTVLFIIVSFMRPRMGSVTLYGWFFWFGMILAHHRILDRLLNYREKTKAESCLKIAGEAAAFLFLCVFRELVLSGTKMEYYLDWLVCAVLILFVSEIVNHTKIKKGVLEAIGRYSFEMYLIHAVFLKYWGKYICHSHNCAVVLACIFIPTFIAAVILNNAGRRLGFSALFRWAESSGGKSVRCAEAALAGAVLLLMLPEAIANIGIGNLEFYEEAVTMENNTWKVPLYTETPLFWDLANKTYRSEDSGKVSFVDGVLYSHDIGETSVRVSLPSGKSVSCQVTVE